MREVESRLGITTAPAQEDVLSKSEGGPEGRALLATICRDLDALKVRLHLLQDDELAGLGSAAGELEVQVRRELAQRGDSDPVGDSSGDSSAVGGGRRCPAPDCGRQLISARAHYCSGRCRMRALRERRLLSSQTTVVTEVTPPARRPVDQCVYMCTSCEERFLGERRCPVCNLFNRNLGLGGPCPECEHPIVLADLLPVPAPFTDRRSKT